MTHLHFMIMSAFFWIIHLCVIEMPPDNHLCFNFYFSSNSCFVFFKPFLIIKAFFPCKYKFWLNILCKILNKKHQTYFCNWSNIYFCVFCYIKHHKLAFWKIVDDITALHGLFIWNGITILSIYFNTSVNVTESHAKTYNYFYLCQNMSKKVLLFVIYLRE